MNKKVSTLLTVGLMLGGSLLSSSAFAETLKLAEKPAEKVEAGKQYLFVQEFSTSGKFAYAFELQEDGTFKQVVKKIENGEVDAEDNKNGFLWNVEKVSGSEETAANYTYSFKNLGTNSYLSVSQADNKVVETTKPAEDLKVWKEFVWLGYDAYTGNEPLFLAKDGSKYVTLNGNGTLTFEASNVENSVVNLYEVEGTETEDSDLNALYNRKGFSFDLDSVVGGSKRDIENIFNQRMVALDIKTDVVVKNDQVDGGKWGFPAGTYFTIARPDGGYPADGTNAEKYEYLKACTFIAVSSDECVEVTAGDRANGKGFQLVEITGEELYKYMGDVKAQLPSGSDEVSVWNACFTVKNNSTKKYPYSIKLAKAYFLADDDATGDDAIHTEGKLALNVIEHNKGYYLATEKGEADNYLFKFGESGLVKALSLLENKAAAVYNIKFVSGANDKTELNKYLTVGANDNSWGFVAKGQALAKDVLATPAYQFVITDIDTETNEVTFTNRESGTSFTAKLFNEGDNYSLATKSGSTKTFQVANINNSTYSVSLVRENGAVKNFDLNNVNIVLEKSTVDPFAGFWNVEDGTMVTMAFSRDINSTSNKLYAYVDGDNNLEASNVANLTDELYDAAQWKLEKVQNGIINIKRDYVYNKDGKEAVEPFGDVISVQKYTLRYVKDAEEQKKWWKFDGTTNAPSLVSSDMSEYVIRENADGSVAIMTKDAITPNDENGNVGEFKIASQDVAVVVNDKNKPNYKYEYDKTYKVEEAATDVRTYLLTDAPYKSWEDAGHVTIQSEVGNFLSMNADKDAIMVDNEGSAYYLYKVEDSKIAPSFFISKGTGNENGERLFLFNAVDSIGYQMNRPYDPKYQWSEGMNKLVFKTGIINETRDTLALTVKGEVSKLVANKSNNAQNVWGGLNRFKWQIIETEDGDGYYYIRQKDNSVDEGNYLGSISEKVTWTTKDKAIKFRVEETEAPTSNETVAASEVKVVAQNGSVVVKNAAGKNVVVSTILGQVVANEVLTSDNATINVPAGIVVVAVEGESFKVNVK